MPKFRVTINAVKGVRHPHKGMKWPRTFTVDAANEDEARTAAVNASMLKPEQLESVLCQEAQPSPPLIQTIGESESDTSPGTAKKKSGSSPPTRTSRTKPTHAVSR